MTRRARNILVSGMIAADPHQGGATWAVLQYVLGLRDLGHDVMLVEPIASKSVRPIGAPLADSENARHFHKVVDRFGLSQAASLVRSDSKDTVGVSYDRLREFAEGADAILNISGMLTDESLLSRIPVRLYLDLDPAFNQLWHATQGVDMRLDPHTHFVTVGQSIGTSECSIPTCGKVWIPTMPPVVLAHWPKQEEPLSRDALTTIANWRGYGSIHHNGIHYGQKAHSIRPLFDLPRRCRSSRFELALTIHPDETRDLEALKENDWRLIDPMQAAGTPDRYQQFIASSTGEFGIAKSGYVVSRCGWFSDRSACYLASGRPVIAQDTGFSRHLPTGEGLFAFTNADDVAAAIDALRGDPARHAKAARTLAAELFDSDRVLRQLLDATGVTS